ncbi:MAG: Sec-independent protein translocase subunit TatA [Aeromicrobium sp.]|uniref:Sec-independent protein translocase subunit TatA n=1 Tax=Aeromicrobium sp. TaxID=1871063 RepID=UPI0025BD227A|nr:Sec-independent protein translocase subunit TatA [Aeromicrobium sp.]MCK5890918.1 Sec-independent protein translocase subunit TatA [Aeromicrobium sp.]MDF1705112.1 Sec-independent protein translocase subunit TatA [Aeromicrobium sp.]
MFKGIGAPEILLILAVVLLFFGAAKLPELARGSGRALRIFKSEIKELEDDDQKRASDTEASTDTTSDAEERRTRQVEITRVDGPDDKR